MATHTEDFLRLANEAKERITQIPAAEVKPRMKAGTVVLDVRDREEFETGHIEGAINVSRGTLEMRIHDAVPDKNTPIICYCAAGNRGALAADTLQNLGYSNVSSIEGGLNDFLRLTDKDSR